MKFKTEYYCNAEWAANPVAVEVELAPEWEERIKKQAAALKGIGGNQIKTWWAGGYTFFDDEGEEFEPEYSLYGCHILVYEDEDFQFIFPFKHSDERGNEQQGWTSIRKWSDGRE